MELFIEAITFTYQQKIMQFGVFIMTVYQREN